MKHIDVLFHFITKILDEDDILLKKIDTDPSDIYDQGGI